MNRDPKHRRTAENPRAVDRIAHYYRLSDRRILFFQCVALTLFVILAVGLGVRQLILQGEYREREERQNLRRIVQPAPRGQIVDRNGEILVGNRPRFSAVVYLRELRREFSAEYSSRLNALREAHRAQHPDEPFRFDWEALQWESRQAVLQRYLDEINHLLEREDTLSVRDIQRHFWHRLLMPFPLITDLSHREYARLIEQLPLHSPIEIYTDTARHYPYGQAAAHVLGYVVSNPDIPETTLPGETLRTFSYRNEIGRTGLERAFEDTLQGRSGGEIWIVDRFQYQFESVHEQDAVQGDDLQTSLDIHVQLAAEKALENKTGAVVAIDVRSGEILALASSPSYDLNDLSPHIPQSVFDDINERGAWLNRATQGLYPPGSTFKLITAIAALRAGVVSPDQELFCGSHFRVGNRLFPEHSGTQFGYIDLPTAIERSSNVYMYQVGLETGIDRISEEARRFGLDQPSGVEIPFETSRMVIPDREWSQQARGFGWRPGDTANVSIGQGDLLLTPLQMAAFTASLARGETRTDVTILKRPDNQPIDHGGEKISLPQEYLDAIIDGMARATGPRGTARLAAPTDIPTAGKTGTAQVSVRGERMTLAWLIAFAPVEAPEIAICVMIEGTDARDNFAGGRTAAPIARQVLEAYFAEPRETVSPLAELR